MKVKEYRSLVFNGVDWQAFQLAEYAILLECPNSTSIQKVHESSLAAEEYLGKGLIDIVTAFNSITIFTEYSLDELLSSLAGKTASPLQKTSRDQKNIFKIPICYEIGLDLERVAEKTKLSVNAIIDEHLASTYTVATIGFTPGFIYADGLASSLACPRLENPRKSIAAGSVGIGASQTGIYSLPSPGGWNIIGRTPLQLFAKDSIPPISIGIGSCYQFFRISKKAFDSWEN